ncbi:substrate-binding periplasmic protein [Roseomonas sp. CCTCC AB2023176]|uniref:substrate-binding periplasmic protein n=1 Tax=Roseomonas sp. CCTCC AB2023176 TaxID=3342640 RepID=UPI0035DB523B
MTAAIFAFLALLGEGASPAAAQGGPGQARPPRPSAAVPQPAPAPPRSDRVSVVRARGELLVCTSRDLLGLGWRNPRNGELEGLDTDLGRALAARLEVRARFVEAPSDLVLVGLEEGRCDIAIGGVAVTPARAERVAFAKPYLTGPLTVVTAGGTARVRSWNELDRGGIVIAVQPGSVAEEMLRDNLRAAELLVTRPPLAPEQEVASGRADALVTDFAGSRHMRDDNAWRVIDAPRGAREVLYAMAVPRGEGGWLAEVNAFLGTVRSDGTMARSAQRWGLTGNLMP